MSKERFDRNIRLFGEEGQQRIRETTCTVIGIGGLGTHVVQQLALLGVGKMHLIDSEELDESNRNRYVGACHDDPIPGTPKVMLGERLVNHVDPSIAVETVEDSFISKGGYAAIRCADYVFGCIDCEGARLVLTEICSAYARPYFDLASDVIPGERLQYGGRICTAVGAKGCLVCLDVLDMEEAGEDMEGDVERRNREALYGVDRRALGRSGPSVVSVNGVIASLAVTEFMGAVTGIRSPNRHVNYYGHTGKVTVSQVAARDGCWYCGLWGKGEEVDVERYLRSGLGKLIR